MRRAWWIVQGRVKRLRFGSGSEGLPRGKVSDRLISKQRELGDLEADRTGLGVTRREVDASTSREVRCWARKEVELLAVIVVRAQSISLGRREETRW